MNCVTKRMNVADDVDNNKTERNLSNALPNVTYFDWMFVYVCLCVCVHHMFTDTREKQRKDI